MPGAVSWESIEAQALGQLVAFALGGAITPVLGPLSQSAANEAWSANPSMPTDANVLALLVRLGAMELQTAVDESEKSGVGTDSLNRMIAALVQPPSINELMDLVNRGEMAEDDALQIAVLGGSDPRYVADQFKLRMQLLSPSDLAMMRQQNFIQQEEQIARSALAGVNADEAELLFDISGEPPGPEQMIALWRRGKATEDDVKAAIVEGRIKLKWTDAILNLKEVPLSASVAAEAVLRERTLPQDPHYYAEAAGLSDADFDAWVDMMGRPPGVMEALTLVNRRIHGDPNGETAKAFFREVVARSDVRTEYADDLFNLRTHYPPLFQVQRALTAGTVTKEIASTTLQDEGYPAEWVNAIVNSHTGSGSTKAKDISAGTIEALYVAGIDDHKQAIDALAVLGYDDAEAEMYLQAWTARRIASEIIHGVTLVRTKFTGWKIDETETRADLADFALTPSTIDRLVVFWRDERKANTPQLAHGQITTAFKYGRYTYDEATQMLLTLGWSQADTLTLLWNTVHGDPRPNATQTPTAPVVVTPLPPAPAG